MATSGSTVGTPISIGSPAAVTTQPLPYTLLPLATYARIMGVTPPHFWGAAGTTYFPVGIGAGCDEIWHQYSWQNADKVSRYDLAEAIQQAEAEITNVLGYSPAPAWVAKETHIYPRHHRRELYGNSYNARSLHKSVKARLGKFIQAGQRATTIISAGATVTYTDEDGDGYKETATVTASTSVTDKCEIKVYHNGQGGVKEWEIRPAKSITLSSGTVTIKFDAWLLLDPDLQAAAPTTADPSAIDLENISNYVASVDIYREHTDFTEESAEFYWEPSCETWLCTTCSGSGCVTCTLTTQIGCIYVRNVNSGVVVPTPATYDSDNSQWASAEWAVCREPDQVKIWYYAGELSNDYLSGLSCQPMNHNLARAISYLATARLERPVCGCTNAQSLSQNLQQDLSRSDDAGSNFLANEILSNPFGTRQGEIRAWQMIANLTDRILDVALV